MSHTDPHLIAEAVRTACLHAAREAHEQASISGLCGEGAWEAALGAIQTLDLDALLSDLTASSPPPR
ncbi:acetyltransferase [Ectothiorhodospiraceae bacterium 2226]|nr:acetyltransferase [Ectothiorhodospiraceae bacterium 2226]